VANSKVMNDKLKWIAFTC